MEPRLAAAISSARLASVERGLVVPGRVCEHRPFAEGIAVLHLFGGPGIGSPAEVGVVAEHAVEVDGVVRAVPLHHRGGLHQGDQLGVRHGGIEPVPGHVLEAPMLHRRIRTVRSRAAKLASIRGIRKGGRIREA
jgi:hypothetical protein